MNNDRNHRVLRIEKTGSDVTSKDQHPQQVCHLEKEGPIMRSFRVGKMDRDTETEQRGESGIGPSLQSGICQVTDSGPIRQFLQNESSPQPKELEPIRENKIPVPESKVHIPENKGSSPEEKMAPPVFTMEGTSLDYFAEQLIAVCPFLEMDGTLYAFNGEIYEMVDKRKLSAIIQRKLDLSVRKRISTIKKVQDIEEWLTDSPVIPHMTAWQAYQENRYLIPFANGVYDVEQARLLDFSPELKVFYQLGAAYQDDCEGLPPVFNYFMNTAFEGDEGCKNLLLEILGYVMMPCKEAKKFFVFGTARDSGKSLLANFLSCIWGREHISRVGLHSLKERFHLKKVAMSCVNFSMDLKAGALKADDVEIIKNITGEFELPDEGKYVDPGMDFSTCKLICGTNHPLQIRSEDSALWERLVVVPFQHTCPAEQRNPKLLDKLLNEKDDIVTCAAWAATRLLNRNFSFTEPEAARKLKDQWIFEAGGDVEAFIKNNCQVTGDENDFLESGDLYEKYCEWSLHPVTKNIFSAKVRKLFCIDFDKRRKRIGGQLATGMFGLKWKEE